MQEPPISLQASQESGNEGFPSRLTPAPNVQSNFTELCNHPLFSANIIRMTQEEVRRIHVFETDKSLINVVEDALSYGFHIGHEEANDGLKNVSFYFVEIVLINIT